MVHECEDVAHMEQCAVVQAQGGGTKTHVFVPTAVERVQTLVDGALDGGQRHRRACHGGQRTALVGEQA